jgi:hypothetical protein
VNDYHSDEHERRDSIEEDKIEKGIFCILDDWLTRCLIERDLLIDQLIDQLID